ncbi:MAG: hypothetical protein HC919_11975 [Oscillatoriales cyanobacterium SM2_2_1]|nr:hypothetical protein [Oscillatoriales cyanobacterium SM2_2_1]
MANLSKRSPYFGISMIKNFSILLGSTVALSLISPMAIAQTITGNVRTQFIRGCIDGATRNGATRAQAQSYCECSATELNKQDPALVREFFTAVGNKKEPSNNVKAMVVKVVSTCRPKAR